MSIKGLQAKLTPLGRIRLGVFESSGKGRPAKLDTFRFTSPSEKDIRVIADLYGGEARPWTHRTLNQPQFEVVTEAKLVPVFVPAQRIDPFMELWGKGFCARRCDGEQELLSGEPCLCEASGERQCKPTTRFSVLLADLQGLGGWGVESHGWNAAGELAMVASALETAPAPVPADLVIDWRQEKKLVGGDLKTFQYAVPVLRFRWFTPQQAFAGQLEAGGWAAVGSAERTAIGSGPQSVEQRALLARIGAAETRAEIVALREEADQLGLGEAWTAQARMIHAAEQSAAAAPRPGGAAESVVEAEVVDGEAAQVDADALWHQIVAAAGMQGWNTAQLTAAAGAWLTERFGVDHWTARPEHFAAFAKAMADGEVRP